MMMKDGYIPPRDKVFDEIIEKCRLIWLSNFTDSAQEYVDEKLDRLNAIKNEGADVMFALQMFHPVLRFAVIRNFSAEARDYVKYYEQVNENQRSDTEETH